MPSLVLSEHKQNQNPLQPGHFRQWTNFRAPQSDSGAWVVSAFAASRPGPQQSDVLTIEDVRIQTGRDEEGDPAHKLHFKVRNVGPSTVERYVVNVWHLLP